MNRQFEVRIKRLPIYLAAFKKCKHCLRDSLACVPIKGVYMFVENRKPIYIGRTNRMAQRLLEHSRKSSSHYHASFAFKLAKSEAIKVGINTVATRKTLETDIQFKALFDEAKKRVAKMAIKYVEINDPVDQALFEVYASEVFKTPMNDFENH
jgi:predicted GIY-YIG superfamily endonuclease